MAVNKLHPISSRLDNRIAYILDPVKTEQGLLTGGVNTTPPTAYADMRGTQERFGKHGGRIAYHWIESFAPGEITAREAMRMGREMIHRYLGDRYEAVYAVHNDHEHIHVHIIWNATSFIDGKKFHAPPGTYLGQIRRESDALCKERGYAVVRRGEKNNGRSYGEWKADRDGQITLRDTIRRDVDAAIRASVTLKGFGQALRSMGYEIKNTPQSISLLAPGAKRFVRLRSLGAHYTQEAILERILRQQQRQHLPAYREPKKRRAAYRGSFSLYKPTWKGLRALYYHYRYLLRKSRNGVDFIPNREIAYLMREDCRKLERYSERVKLMHRYKIDTAEDVRQFLAGTKTKIATLTKQRNKSPKDARSEMNERLKTKRKELRTANDILTDANILRERLRQAYRPTKEQERTRTPLQSRDARGMIR